MVPLRVNLLIVMAQIPHYRIARALMFMLFVTGVFTIKVSAQTTTSSASVWSSTSSWTPSSVPGPTSTVNVTYPITIDQGISVSSGTYSFSANATDLAGSTAYSLNMTGGKLTVNAGSIVTFEGTSMVDDVTILIKSGGTLIVGALTINNNSKITIEPGGTLIVNGNLTDNNNGTGVMEVGGYVQVNGNYSAAVGGIEILGSTGVFQTTGTIITQGGSTVFGSPNDCTTGPCSGSSLTCGYRNQISPTSQTVCSGQTATVITSSNDVPTGTTVTYQWQWSASQGSGFTSISNASSSSLDPYNSGDATVNSRLANRLDTYFRVKLVVNGCPATPENYSASSGIIFNSLTPPTVSLTSTSFSACTGTSSTVNVAYSVSSGSVSKYSLSWSPSTGNLPTANNNNISGSPISFTVPANAVTGTYTGTLTFYDANSCTPGTKTITLVVGSSAPVLSGLSTTQICETGVAQSTSLTYSSTNNPATYSITWNATATTAGFSSVNNASVSASPLSVSVPSGAIAGATYTGTLTLTNACGTSAGQTFNVTLLAKPSITLGSSPSVCSGTTSASLPYSATSGSPTTYSIGWDASALSAGFAAVSNTILPSSPISITVPANAPAATYNGTLTVRNGNSCVSTSNVFTVTINALPTITLGTSPTVCAGITSATLAYSSTGTPTNCSITWDATALGENFVNVVNATLQNPITLGIPASAVAGTYSGEVVVTNTNSCISLSAGFNVTITDSGILTWTGDADNNWLNTANWSCPLIPTVSKHVVIPGSLTNYPVINGSASANDLTISAGASLTISNTSTLSVAGHFTNSGVFTSNQGTVAFTGSASQNINNNGASFYTIQVNKSGGSLSVFQNLPLIHLLDIQSATAVNSNGNLVLMSSDSTTANDASIGLIPTGASVNGTITVNRYISNAGNINRYVAAPVYGVTTAMFSDDMTVKSGATIRYYNEPVAGAMVNGYVYVPGTGSFTLGRGYLAYMYDKKRIHLDVTGTIHKGEFDYIAKNVLSYTTTSGGVSADGWNLVGNPYPSAITWGTTGWVRDNGGTSYVDGTISVPDLSLTSGYPNYYHSYNYADGTGDLPGGIIAMGQAFWVHITSASAVLKVNESAKTSSGSGRFYRENTRSESQFLKISVSNDEIADNSFFKINEKATDAFDVYDGYKFKNPVINSFLIDKDNNHLVMHTLREIKEKDKIFIGIEVAEQGEYKLSISNTEDFSNASDLFFVDRSQGVVIPVNEISDYRFSLADVRSAVTDRFFITRDKSEIAKYEGTLAVYPNPVEGILNLRAASNIETATAQLMDQNGKLLLEYKWKGVGQIDMSQFRHGIFILKIKTADRIDIRKIVRR
jgi:hypothetical protein